MEIPFNGWVFVYRKNLREIPKAIELEGFDAEVSEKGSAFLGPSADPAPPFWIHIGRRGEFEVSRAPTVVPIGVEVHFVVHVMGSQSFRVSDDVPDGNQGIGDAGEQIGGRFFSLTCRSRDSFSIKASFSFPSYPWSKKSWD